MKFFDVLKEARHRRGVATVIREIKVLFDGGGGKSDRLLFVLKLICVLNSICEGDFLIFDFVESGLL